MNYLRIISEIARTQWAMLPSAFRAVLAVLDGEQLEQTDRSLFHAAEEEMPSMLADLGTPLEGTRFASVRQNIGFLFIDGPIIPRADYFSEVSGMVSIERLTNEFLKLEQMESISEIVLIMDTPGGAVTGVSDFAHLVHNSEKSTTAYVWGMAASAGYWIASAADTLVSADTGMVGSIGTVISMTDDSERMKKKGLKRVEIVSEQSPHKRPDVSTPEGAATVQQLVNDLSDVFINTVANNRSVSYDDVLNKFGGGAMFVADRAAQAGMIDSIGTLNDLIQGLESDRKPTLQGFGFSASGQTSGAPIAKEGNTMTKENEATPLVAEEKETFAMEAVQAEHKRIQEIEALMGCVSNAPASVQNEARKLVDSRKYDAKATAGNIAPLLLDLVNNAKAEQFAQTATSARELATVAASVAVVDEPEVDEKEVESKARVARLAAGMKEVNNAV